MPKTASKPVRKPSPATAQDRASKAAMDARYGQAKTGSARFAGKKASGSTRKK